MEAKNGQKFWLRDTIRFSSVAAIIGGAVLDVFEQEPLTADNRLMKMDNVMLAPHNANSSPQAWEMVHHNTINNLIKVLKDQDR